VPAQYGQHSAGAVEAVTKSGTNEFHHSLKRTARSVNGGPQWRHQTLYRKRSGVHDSRVPRPSVRNQVNPSQLTSCPGA
jgi:hypothetical protein